MPADACAGGVFVDQDLLQLVGGDAGKSGDLLAKRQEEWRNILARLQCRRGIVVAPSERDDTAVAQEAMEFEWLEGQLLDSVDKRPLVLGRDHAFPVIEALRPCPSCAEQLGLIWRLDASPAHGSNSVPIPMQMAIWVLRQQISAG